MIVNKLVSFKIILILFHPVKQTVQTNDAFQKTLFPKFVNPQKEKNLKKSFVRRKGFLTVRSHLSWTVFAQECCRFVCGNAHLACSFSVLMVRERGFEPLRPKTPEPKSGASANSATRACTIPTIASFFEKRKRRDLFL